MRLLLNFFTELVEGSDIGFTQLPTHCTGITRACLAFFAPGIGTAPLEINQFKATWEMLLSPFSRPIIRILRIKGWILPINPWL